MRHTIFKLLLFLLALLAGGAIINVAVAWGCSVRQQRNGAGNYSSANFAQMTATWSAYAQTVAFDPLSQTRYDFHMQSGWPLLSMEAWAHVDFSGPAPISKLKRAFELEPHGGNWPWIWFPRLLPLSPAPAGFVLNTLLYTAILFMLFVNPWMVRRWVAKGRIKRGQCAACGYSLRENVSAKCPECGAPAG